MSFAITGTVLTVGGAAYGANRAGAAADAQAGAANQANALSESQYQRTRADNAPWQTTGGGAINQLGSLFGLPTTTAEQYAAQQPVTVGDTQLPAGTQLIPAGNGWYDVTLNGTNIGVLRPGGANGRFVSNGTPIPATNSQAAVQTAPTNQTASTPASTPGTPNLNAFTASPGYEFRRSEGLRGLENSAAAMGGAFSGNALRALTEFNSGLASQEFGNYVNQLAGIAGVGQTATNQVSAYGQNAANNQGQNALYAGQARASGIENQGNIYGQAINGLAGIAGYYGRPQQGLSNSAFNSVVNPYQITGAASRRMY